MPLEDLVDMEEEKKRLELEDEKKLKRIEDGTQIVKDFELIGLCKVLDVNYDDLKNCIE